MENSVKALNMAIGVFLGILIISFFVLIFSRGGSIFGAAEEMKASEKIEAYNSKLIIYNRSGEVEDYNTIYDVVTACNLAYDINKENDFFSDATLQIELFLTPGGISPDYTMKLDATQEKGKIRY